MSETEFVDFDIVRWGESQFGIGVSNNPVFLSVKLTTAVSRNIQDGISIITRYPRSMPAPKCQIFLVGSQIELCGGTRPSKMREEDAALLFDMMWLWDGKRERWCYVVDAFPPRPKFCSRVESDIERWQASEFGRNE